MLNHLKKFFTPRPSVFDLSVAVFAIVPWIHGDRDRSIFMVFYAAFLVAYSLSMKPKREYRSLPLTLLVIWSLVNVFIHSFEIYPSSGTTLYRNFYLMLEGFLYIFFAALFIKTVVTYSTNIKFIFFLLPISILPWIDDLSRTGAVTTTAALGLALFIYLLFSKLYRKWALPISMVGIIGIVLNFKWIIFKFSYRPKVWWQLIKEAFYSPVQYVGKDIVSPGIELSPFLKRFVGEHISDKVQPWLATVFGNGFSPYLDPNYTWVTNNNYGWLYRQSDYFAIASDLGPLMLMLVVWFIIDSFKKIGIQPVVIGFTMIVLACFFQITMYVPFKAGPYLLLGTLCITEGIRRSV